MKSHQRLTQVFSVVFSFSFLCGVGANAQGLGFFSDSSTRHEISIQCDLSKTAAPSDTMKKVIQQVSQGQSVKVVSCGSYELGLMGISVRSNQSVITMGCKTQSIQGIYTYGGRDLSYQPKFVRFIRVSDLTEQDRAGECLIDLNQNVKEVGGVINQSMMIILPKMGSAKTQGRNPSISE